MPRKLIASFAAAATLVTGMMTSGSIASADTAAQVGDGTTSPTAGASCWGIKQAYPSSTNGVYWLNNASMEAPERYYCDMTTDGGGWVLVGRGRNGWNFATEGQGSRSTLRDAVDGPGAFAPATLASAEIDRLLGNQPIESLTDGIRLRRATNKSGSNRQEIRMRPRTFGPWSWGLDGGIVLDSISIDGTSFGTSNTRDTNASWAGVSSGLSNNDNERRINTLVQSNKGYQGGFGLGRRYRNSVTSIRGDNSATSYLWEYTTEGRPLGFTQVFVRPRIANTDAGFTTLPPGGLPAEAQATRLKTRAEFAPWGVVGNDHTNEATAEPWFTNTLALAVSGDRVFVGGRFTGVQNGPSATAVSQPYLAAFDRTTGAWIDTFRPALDGRVYDIQVADDGNLLIGGDFTQVNGDANATALAKIDPATGAVVTSWKADLARVDSSGARAIVRAIAVAPDGIYAAGNFNRLTGGTWNQITVSRAVKVSSTNGSPFSAWKPAPNGTVVDMDVTPTGDQVYLAGYFSRVNNDTSKASFAGVDSTTGASIPGQAPFQPSLGSKKTYQQAVLVDGDYVYVGGSEHNTQKYRRSDGQLVRAYITRQGGDTQAFLKYRDSILAGCHCGDIIYSDTNSYNSPATAAGFSRLDPINLAASLSVSDFTYDREWVPQGLKGDNGEGIWDFASSNDGCVFVGGDLNRSGFSGDANSWIGGFAKFCDDDSTPPSAPSNVQVQAVDTSTARITFTPGTDNSGSAQAWIYKDDRVIGVSYNGSFTDTSATGPARYTVRTVDNTRNKSATPPLVSYTPPAPSAGPLLSTGATWHYLDSGSDPGATWATTGFDDSSWAAGTAPLGWGEDGLATTVGASKPTVSYYRTTFNADPDNLGAVMIKIRRDDGAAIYLNGVEVARSNLPAGQLGNQTLASDYTWGAQEVQYFEYVVPASLLNDGQNTVAVRLHQASASNADASFDLSIDGLGSTGDAAAPTVPDLTATGSANAADLSWTASVDANLLGYTVLRDGAPIAFTPNTTYTDGGLGYSESHDYSVQAVDGDGNSASSTMVTATTAPNTALMSYGSTWKWSYDGTAPAADWTSAAFDDASWATGVGEFGYGDNDEATKLTTAAAPRPLVGYFRTAVNITDPSAFSTIAIDTIRDDGAVVYVNGIEVGRDNLPAGPVTNSTGAVTALTTRAQETTPVTFTVPASAFHAGQNTIAVSVHNTDRWSGDLSFDMRMNGTV